LHCRQLIFTPRHSRWLVVWIEQLKSIQSAFQPRGTGIGSVPGGIITFGGGVALYASGKVIGRLGVSGDSACADHVIVYRMRKNAGLDGIPKGVGFNGTDNIDYPAGTQTPSGFQDPHCFPQDIAPGNI
jgi:hypothetical protein